MVVSFKVSVLIIHTISIKIIKILDVRIMNPKVRVILQSGIFSSIRLSSKQGFHPLSFISTKGFTLLHIMSVGLGLF